MRALCTVFDNFISYFPFCRFYHDPDTDNGGLLVHGPFHSLTKDFSCETLYLYLLLRKGNSNDVPKRTPKPIRFRFGGTLGLAPDRDPLAFIEIFLTVGSEL